MKRKITLTRSGNPRAPFEVSFADNGKRKKRRFATEFDARQFYDELKREDDMPELLKASDTERLFLARVKRLAEPFGVSLDVVEDIVKRHIGEVASSGCGWEPALDEYIRHCYRRNLRATTVEWYLRILRRFGREESVQDVRECTQERVGEWLAGLSSPLHFKRVLTPFFEFCRRKKWIAANPANGSELVMKRADRSIPQIITPEQVETLFAELPDAWKPAVALMAFAGLRPLEVLPCEENSDVIKTGDIKFGEEMIIVRAGVAKTRAERRLTGLPAILWHYLLPLYSPDLTSNVAPGSYAAWRKIKERLSVPLKKDVLRHSFASYAYHYLGAERTVEILGHVGGFGVFAKHYKGLADADSAREYFGELPARGAKKTAVKTAVAPRG